jgi:transposase InsO family protein
VSKARLVITAVVIEGRPQADVARSYGVSKGWVSKLVARYTAEGDSAFQARSRRPKTSPTAIPESTVELIVALRRQLSAQGLDAGADTIGWHLEHHHQLRVSRATIDRTLRRHGLIKPTPAKRPRSSYVRFQAEQPNEMWQADFTHYPLTSGDDTEILSWLDDHARHAEPGSPWENPFVESFNGRTRDELLNIEEFGTLLQAKVVIEAWRVEYNTYRPHSSLDGLTPAEYAEHCIINQPSLP